MMPEGYESADGARQTEREPKRKSCEPIGESVVRHGPFVMNSKQEILQAVDDYRSGLLGTLD